MICSRIFRDSAVAGLILLWPGVAAAQSASSIHGLGGATVGYSDNFLAAPSDPAPGQPGPEEAWFTQLETGLAFLHHSARAQHVLTLTRGTNFAFGMESEHSTSTAVRWEAFFALSPRDELALGASVDLAASRVAVLARPTAQGGAPPQTFTDDELFIFGAAERYVYELTPHWRLNQNVTLEGATPYSTQEAQPTRLQPRLGVGASYAITHDAFGLQGEAGYFWQTDPGGDDVLQPLSGEVLTEVRAEWTHDLTEAWSTYAAFGVAHAMPAEDTSTMVGALIWQGAIRYDNDGYSAELAGERMVVPSMLLSQVLLTDQGSLAGGVPLVRSLNLHIGSTLAYAHHRALDLDRGVFANEFDTAIADVGLEWRAEGLPWFALRYQHQRQLGDETGDVPVASFERNTVSLSMGFMIPARTIPRVRDVPSRRVDGRDRDPLSPGEGSAPRMNRRRQ